jgi:hypothetical protein
MKSEIRNPKSETNPKFEGRNFSNCADRSAAMFWKFEFSDFEFVSDFGFRISDFEGL